jgi:dTDP-4-amino-4,6-dideoxygalactose transaminase
MNKLVERIRIPLFEAQLGYVNEAIRAGHLARGPHLGILGKRLTRLFGKRHAVLTANGFSALFAALKVARPVPTRVLTAPASTCFAIVNAIKAAGHKPCFADMDPASASLAGFAPDDDNSETLTAIVPDHFGIIAPDCRGPRRRRGLLIEDAAQSFISRSRVPAVSDVLVLSFYPTKLVNGIDGGAVLTDDEDIFRRLSAFVSYADQTKMEPGARYNLGMNNVNAAFALGTLAHLDDITAALGALHRRLRSVLEKRGIGFLYPAPEEVPSRLIMVAESKMQRESMMSRMWKAGIQVSQELMPLCEPAVGARFVGMQRLLATTMSLPFHPMMSDAEVTTIESAIRQL